MGLAYGWEFQEGGGGAALGLQEPAEHCAERGRIYRVGQRGSDHVTPLGPVHVGLRFVADSRKAMPWLRHLRVGHRHARRDGAEAVGACEVFTDEGDGEPTFFVADRITDGTGIYDGARGRSTLNVTFSNDDEGFRRIAGHGRIRK